MKVWMIAVGFAVGSGCSDPEPVFRQAVIAPEEVLRGGADVPIWCLQISVDGAPSSCLAVAIRGFSHRWGYRSELVAEEIVDSEGEVLDALPYHWDLRELHDEVRDPVGTPYTVSTQPAPGPVFLEASPGVLSMVGMRVACEAPACAALAGSQDKFRVELELTANEGVPLRLLSYEVL